MLVRRMFRKSFLGFFLVKHFASPLPHTSPGKLFPWASLRRQ